MKALTICTALLFHLSSLAQVKAEVRFNYKRGSYKGCYYDVVVTKNGKQHNISFFRPWENIEKVLLSPDERFMIVWHKPQLGKSYLLSVYDLNAFRLVKQVAPGYGGDFSWNNHHQVIHEWGCGTNCANFSIYGLQLNELFFTLSSGGFLLSPGKDFLIQYSMHGDRLWVYDLRQIRPGLKPLVYACDIAPGYCTDQIKFTNKNRVELVATGTGLQNKYVNLDKVQWKRMDTKGIGEFYGRKY